MSDDIKVSSTTDTAEDIAAAAGVKPEAVESEAEEPKLAAEPETAKDGENKPDHKGKGKISERISELVKQRNEARDRAAELESRLSAKDGDKPEPKTDSRPTVDQFKTWEEYNEALIDWKTDQKLQSERAKEAQAHENERLKRNFASYNKQVAEFIAENEDFEEVVGRDDIQIPQVAQLAIFEMDNGPAVAYYLATHQEEIDKLLDLNKESLVKVVAEVTRISDKLKGSPEPKRPVTAAPTPIKPVGGAATRSTVPTDEMPYSEWKKLRTKQVAESRRR